MESKPKKRVLFIVTLNEIGGAQKFISALINSLDPEKYELTAAAGDNSTGDFLKLFKPPVQTRLIKRLGRNPNLLNDILAVFEIRKVIKESGAETIFLNSSKTGFIGSLATVFPMKIKNLKVIYRIGGWTFDDPWPKWKKLVWVWLEKISSRWKDIIILNNGHDYKLAEKYNIRPKNKIVVIYNGLDVYKMDFLPREEARLRLFEKISKHSGKIFQIKTVIGTIANFYPTKDLDTLIKTANEFKDDENIAFVVIGDGPERPKLESMIKELGLNNKLFLIGQIEKASRLLNAFDIFTLISVKEGFSWALIEAMSAKLPVIATRVGAIPEIIEDGKNGFIVESGNAEQIADRIKKVIEDDHLKQELGIQAHQTVLFKFTLDKMIRQVEELL